jgi:hypothetical protein
MLRWKIGGIYPILLPSEHLAKTGAREKENTPQQGKRRRKEADKARSRKG